MENPIDLEREIRRLSVKTGFSSRLLEKDFYLTRVLQEISYKGMGDLVFKGGTCLNKCYLGFYRLSEDLDFVLDKDIKNFSYKQTKKILDNLRRELFGVLNEAGLKTNKELGKGWKMITSKRQKIIGLEINSTYESLLDNISQNIKLEVSFRNKLRCPPKSRPVNHEFVDALGEPIIEENINVRSIDLSENFAEKIRSLVTRKEVAARDLFDIYTILKKNAIKLNQEIIFLSLSKIKNPNRSKLRGIFSVYSGFYNTASCGV